MKKSIVAGQPSWQFASDKVEAAITEMGGHLAPVRFRLGRRVIEPFSIAPWATEKLAQRTPPVLQALRGDFFCAPFGGNVSPYRTEKHPPHGETANAKWRFLSIEEDARCTTLKLSLRTKIRSGRIRKSIQLRKGQTALYCRHELSGMKGKMNVGHPAMLKFPDAPESGHISTSQIQYAQVLPTLLEDPDQRGYSSLQPGAIFTRLERVPTIFGGLVNISRYPARRGFEDLIMVVHAARGKLAWTAVTFPDEGYVWFSLKDPHVLQSMVMWISNGGRHYAPWNGRHVNVIGLEDVTSFFHYGLAESARKNSVNREGFATSLSLNPHSPLVVNYIMAVAAIPRDFEIVKTIRSDPGSIFLTSPSRRTVRVKVDTDFLYSLPQ